MTNELVKSMVKVWGRLIDLDESMSSPQPASKPSWGQRSWCNATSRAKRSGQLSSSRNSQISIILDCF